MEITVRENPAEHRFEAVVDDEPAGFVQYNLAEDEAAFVHTEVDDGFAGKGVGSTLVRAALDEAAQRGWSVLPYCPFVRRFIQRHGEYVELVPEDKRAPFGLA